MALGMEAGLGPVHIVLDGDIAPLPQKGDTILGPRLLWPNGCMDQDAAWYGGRPQPTRTRATLCSMWTQLPTKKGYIHPTQFLGNVYCDQMAG